MEWSRWMRLFGERGTFFYSLPHLGITIVMFLWTFSFWPSRPSTSRTNKQITKQTINWASTLKTPALSPKP